VSFEEEVREFFPVCPLCGNESRRIKIVKSFGKDTMTCTNCGAKWHLYCSSGLFPGFKRARLEVEADDGTGKELLQRQIENNQWEEMARKARNRQKAIQQSQSTHQYSKRRRRL
jgi:predicted RNA-binding Zn-ribbon protein involved in translation (DUF1610 family)